MTGFRAAMAAPIRPLLIAAVTAGLGAGCATLNVITSALALPDLELSEMPTQADYPGQGAVVLLDRQEVAFKVIDGDAVADVTTTKRIKLLGQSGRAAMNLPIVFNSELQEVTELAGRITTPNGEAAYLDREHAIDTMYVPSFVLYGDSRIIYFDNRSAPIGSVLDVKYTVRQKLAWLFMEGHLFGSGWPVKRSELIVTAPAGFEIEHVARQFNRDIDLAPEVDDEDGRTRWRWTQADLAPLLERDDAPPAFHQAPLVWLRLARFRIAGELREPFAGIEDVSRYEYEQAKNRLKVSPEIEQVRARALAGAPDDPRERAARLYTWVRDNVRYCAIEVGLGGFIPHPSDQTMSLSYGDCKDKANLLRALLHADGIKARLASIHSHQGYPKRYALPVVGGNANHMILVIDLEDGPVVVDPTTRLVPFGHLPFGDQGADVLPEDTQGVGLLTTPWSTPATNREVIITRGRLTKTGRLEADVRFEASGEIARRYRGAFLYRTLDQRNEALAALWSLDNPESVTPVALEGEVPQLRPTPVKGAAKVSVENVTFGSGRTQLVSLFSLLDDRIGALDAERTDVPLLLGVPRERIHRYSLTLPPGFAVERLPPAQHIDNELFSLSTAATVHGDRLELERTVVVKHPVAETEQLQAVTKALKQARAATRDAVVFSTFARSNPMPVAPPAAPPPSPTAVPPPPPPALEGVDDEAPDDLEHLDDGEALK